MKRMILSTVLIAGLAVAASAQTATGNSSKTTRAASNTTKAKTTGKAALKPSDTLNNRRIYHFKNGQRATPTGHEATPSGIGGGYAALGQNNKAPAPPKKQAQKSKATTKRSN